MKKESNLLRGIEKTELLRFVTAGSVDDGKSTLIGRLLYDSKSIFEDHMSAVKRDTIKLRGIDTPDLSLLVDGLRSEREQGITIDVAYRYFSTPRRKFIIADTPGHEQYTRNMATGASTADLAILLVDARQGILTQTKRHSFIASLLGVHHIVVAINKMDLIDYDKATYEKIKSDYLDFATRLPVRDLHVMPISALKGDNVVKRSTQMPWFDGPSLLHYLETVHVASDRNLIDMRFPVQHVLRQGSEFRGYSGTVASGLLRQGAEVLVLPSLQKSRVEKIVTYDKELPEAYPPMAVTITLADELDVGRGSILVYPKNVPDKLNQLDSTIVWMNEKPADLSRQYLVKHTTNLVPAKISQVDYRIDVNTLHRESADTLKLNEVGRVSIALNRPIWADTYQKNKATGCFILIDKLTNETVASGTIINRRKQSLSSEPSQEHSTAVTRTEREKRDRYKTCHIIVSGERAEELLDALERALFNRKIPSTRLPLSEKTIAELLLSQGTILLTIDDSENKSSKTTSCTIHFFENKEELHYELDSKGEDKLTEEGQNILKSVIDCGEKEEDS